MSETSGIFVKVYYRTSEVAALVGILFPEPVLPKAGDIPGNGSDPPKFTVSSATGPAEGFHFDIPMSKETFMKLIFSKGVDSDASTGRLTKDLKSGFERYLADPSNRFAYYHFAMVSARFEKDDPRATLVNEALGTIHSTLIEESGLDLTDARVAFDIEFVEPGGIQRSEERTFKTRALRGHPVRCVINPVSGVAVSALRIGNIVQTTAGDLVIAGIDLPDEEDKTYRILLRRMREPGSGAVPRPEFEAIGLLENMKVVRTALSEPSETNPALFGIVVVLVVAILLLLLLWSAG